MLRRNAIRFCKELFAPFKLAPFIKYMIILKNNKRWRLNIDECLLQNTINTFTEAPYDLCVNIMVIIYPLATLSLQHWN